ncbi:MAG: type IV secretion system protein [Dongiaceae bacterium]
MTPAAIDPAAINAAQELIVGQLQAGFARVQAIAWPLLYAFAVIELVLLGIGVAFGRGGVANELLGKLLRIGLIVLLIGNHAELLRVVLQGFSWVGAGAGGEAGLAAMQEAVARPARLWQLGYDPALRLFEVAAAADGQQPGIAIIYAGLGFGLLAAFGLIAAQLIFAIVGFYCVALVGLLLVPLGIFRPTERLLDRALGQVLAAAARVLAIGILVAALVALWSKLTIADFTLKTPIDQPVGLLLLAATFALLGAKLPALAARAVGLIGARAPVPPPAAPEPARARPELRLVAGTDLAAGRAAALDREAEARRETGLAAAAGPAALIFGAAAPGLAVRALEAPPAAAVRAAAPGPEPFAAVRGAGLRLSSHHSVDAMAAAFARALRQDRERETELARKARRLQAMRAAAGRRPPEPDGDAPPA